MKSEVIEKIDTSGLGESALESNVESEKNQVYVEDIIEYIKFAVRQVLQESTTPMCTYNADKIADIISKSFSEIKKKMNTSSISYKNDNLQVSGIFHSDVDRLYHNMRAYNSLMPTMDTNLDNVYYGSFYKIKPVITIVTSIVFLVDIKGISIRNIVLEAITDLLNNLKTNYITSVKKTLRDSKIRVMLESYILTIRNRYEVTNHDIFCGPLWENIMIYVKNVY